MILGQLKLPGMLWHWMDPVSTWQPEAGRSFKRTGNPGNRAADEVQAQFQRPLVKAFIALPLLKQMAAADAGATFNVIIDANPDDPGAHAAAPEWILDILCYVIGQSHASTSRLKPVKNKVQSHYLFARLTSQAIRNLWSWTAAPTRKRSNAWLPIRPQTIPAMQPDSSFHSPANQRRI